MQTPSLLEHSSYTSQLKKIAEKVYAGQRITVEEGITLYEKAELGFLGTLANFVREKQNGQKVYFNHNFHVEPTA